jgi:dihydrofolate reductase
MAALTMTTFLSLDGVMQAPGGPGEDESGGFSFGGWLVPHADADMGRVMDGIFEKADAFLLGRTTYDIFAAYWPRVEGHGSQRPGRIKAQFTSEVRGIAHQKQLLLEQYNACP